MDAIAFQGSLTPQGGIGQVPDLPERSRLTRDEFFKIMVAELSNQDPLSPMDNQQFLNQVASLQNLELSSELSEGMASLVFQQRLSSASSLIGKEVLATNSRGEAIQSRVEKVRVVGQSLELILEGDTRISMDSVREITA